MISDRDFFELSLGAERLDYYQLFSNHKPIYIEIGSGKGEFISQYPQIHPEWNFIGFEMSGKRINNILKKLNPQLNSNVRIARRFIDAKITEIIPPESIHGAFIQHPDPWPKRKHHKRRLINQEFLRSMAEILLPGAFIQVSTDHEEYAAWIVDEFINNPYFSSVYDDLVLESSVLDQHIVTWFEQEQKRLGYPPKFMLFKKI